jgi:molybdopterin-biosynthesis enzyme MoeA-like protein
MKRYWYSLAIAVPLLVSRPVSLLAQETGDVDRVKAVLIQLEQLGKKLDNIESGLKQSFPAVAADIGAVKKDVADLTAASKDVQLKLQDAQNRIAQLEKQMAQMRSDMDATQKRIALYPPNGQGRTSYYNSGTVGSLLVENRYAEPILFILNGTPYRVEPNQSRQIEGIPVGTITYEVVSSWGRQARSSTIVANAPLRVTVQ